MMPTSATICTSPLSRNLSFSPSVPISTRSISKWRMRACSAGNFRAMAQRGETPFLHSYADNAGAIALYESLGFRIRREVHVLAIVRA